MGKKKNYSVDIMFSGNSKGNIKRIVDGFEKKRREIAPGSKGYYVTGTSNEIADKVYRLHHRDKDGDG